MKLDLIPESEIRRIMADRDDAQAELARRCGPAHPYKDGCYCSPCMIERQQARIAQLEATLRELINVHVQLIDCGDCGNWDSTQDPNVIAARNALVPNAGLTKETNCVNQPKGE